MLLVLPLPMAVMDCRFSVSFKTASCCVNGRIIRIPMQQGIPAYSWPKTSAGVRKSVHGLAAIRACFHHIRQAAAAISAPATISNSGCKIRNQECQEKAGPSNEGGKEPAGVPPVNETTRQLRRSE